MREIESVHILEDRNAMKTPKTYNARDWPEGGHPLNMVSVASSKSITLRVLATLKHKLLALKRGVLVSHPPMEGYAK